MKSTITIFIFRMRNSFLVLSVLLQILCILYNSNALIYTQAMVTKKNKMLFSLSSDIRKDHDSAPASFSITGISNSNNIQCAIPHERELNRGSEIYFDGPFSNHVLLKWHRKPQRILFLAKPDKSILKHVHSALQYLKSINMELVMENSLMERLIEYETNSTSHLNNLEEMKDFLKSTSIFNSSDKSIDLIVTFGGDGLLLHCSMLFSGRSIPPVMCFDFGSLGFMSPFSFDCFKEEIDKQIAGPMLLTLRMRLNCTIIRNNVECESYSILNEAVVDRGPSPYLCVLDMTCDSQYITTLQGDGIIIATPTGSTAYSMAAGGSIVYPSVPAILLTPICAHTLSFRPMLLPDSSILVCSVPIECRASGWVSFDGRHRQELNRGDKLQIKMSPYPFPTVNRLNFTGDWFDSLRAGFFFNLRARQQHSIESI